VNPIQIHEREEKLMIQLQLSLQIKKKQKSVDLTSLPSNLHSLSRTRLNTIAKSYGIENYESMTTNKIIKTLQNFEEE